MKIWFNDHYRKLRIPPKMVTLLAQRILTATRTPTSEMGITLVGDAEMKHLNQQYRGLDRPTDVLAFPMQEKDSPKRPRGAPRLLGDVVISADTLKKQAKQRRHTQKRELAILIIHGFLHLLGLDHERSPEEAKKMKRQEKRLLNIVSDLIE